MAEESIDNYHLDIVGHWVDYLLLIHGLIILGLGMGAIIFATGRIGNLGFRHGTDIYGLRQWG